MEKGLLIMVEKSRINQSIVSSRLTRVIYASHRSLKKDKVKIRIDLSFQMWLQRVSSQNVQQVYYCLNAILLILSVNQYP